MRRGNGERALIFDAVRHGRELASGAMPDGRKESDGLRAVIVVQAADPVIDLFASGVRWVVVGTSRLFRHAFDERLIILET